MRHTYKITLMILVILSFTPLLSGCWDRVEVNDLAILTMSGIDLTEENQLELSVRINLTAAHPSQGSETSDGGMSMTGDAVVRSVTGNTLAEAVSKLQKLLPRKVFWGHNEVIIFGNRFAQEGLNDALELILRHPETRERANIFISKGTAKEILELEPQIERSLSEKLREMAQLETGLNITLKTLAQMMVSKSRAAVIPCLATTSEHLNQSKFPFIQGTAVIKDGKLIGMVDAQTTRGVMWIRDELNRGTVTVSPENTEGYVSFQLLWSETRVIPKIEGDHWSIILEISTLDDIIENTTNMDLTDVKYIDEMEKKLEEDIRQRVDMAMKQAQEELNADIFQFSNAFYRKYPKIWKENEERWHEIFPNLDIVVHTNAKISRPGMTGKSILKPNQG